jgi:hypothetical protein
MGMVLLFSAARRDDAEYTASVFVVANRRTQMNILMLLLFTCCVIGCATERSPESDGIDTLGRYESSPAQVIDYEADAPASGHTELQAGLIGTMTGAAIRWDAWPNVNGTVNFGFNWGAIHFGSHVYVSASEVDNAGNRFNGLASYTVQNIVVKEGRVEFRIVIDWPSPIRISTDILTINP